MQLLIGAVRYMKWYEVKIWQSYIETCIHLRVKLIIAGPRCQLHDVCMYACVYTYVHTWPPVGKTCRLR